MENVTKPVVVRIPATTDIDALFAELKGLRDSKGKEGDIDVVAGRILCNGLRAQIKEEQKAPAPPKVLTAEQKEARNNKRENSLLEKLAAKYGKALVPAA